MLCQRSIRRFAQLSNSSFNYLKRTLSIDSKSYSDHRSLVVQEFGEPSECVKLIVTKPESLLPKELGPNEILISNLLACVNPADINVIQGVYGKRPKLPAIIGNEGVARVELVGSDVKHLAVGDLGVGVKTIGYWQSYCIRNASEFFKLDKDMELTSAAQLKVNPSTAYRMLKDFINLKSGDVVIQNGANSAVGVYAIQLAKLWGYKTINVIRDRPGKDDLVKELKDFGADYVVTEAEVSNIDIMKPILNAIGKPKLHLNCVGGKNAMNCQRILDSGAYSVTYGAMSKQPFNLSASSLIFKDHRYVGFWVSRWFEDNLNAGRRDKIELMLNDIQQLFIKGQLKAKNSTLISFEDRNKAFLQSNNTKYMFSINK